MTEAQVAVMQRTRKGASWLRSYESRYGGREQGIPPLERACYVLLEGLSDRKPSRFVLGGFRDAFDYCRDNGLLVVVL